jgi:serine-type D-Ala-D-Ala carboxypeptidase/endopeptidase (penicillin-binding protein 4)
VAEFATTVDGGRTAITVMGQPVPGKPGHMNFQVTGTIRTLEWDGRWFRRRVEHPSEFVGQTLRVVLADQKIKLRGKTIKRGAAPATARALATWESAPLGIQVRELAKRSNNFMAEAVLKTMAAQKVAPATWAAGVQVVHDWLETSAGVKAGTYRYDNGSGLYDSNRFTAAQITSVVRAAWFDFRMAPEFLAALAIAGVDGTLGSRMLGTPAARWVRAKTGTLKNVTTLAGVAGAPGTTGAIAFAVLVNDIPEKVKGAGKAARALQDEVAQAAVLMSTP